MNILSEDHNGYVEIYQKAVYEHGDILANFFFNNKACLFLHETNADEFCQIIVDSKDIDHKLNGDDIKITFRSRYIPSSDRKRLVNIISKHGRLTFEIVELLTQLRPEFVLKYLEKFKRI